MEISLAANIVFIAEDSVMSLLFPVISRHLPSLFGILCHKGLSGDSSSCRENDLMCQRQ